MKKKKNRFWRWIRRIVLVIVLIPILALLGVRIFGGMKMRRSNPEIMSFLTQHKVKGVIDTLSIRKRDITYLLTTDGHRHKDAIIFVHGSPGSLDAFLDFMVDTALLSTADLIVYDRPGFGHSGFGKPVNSLAGQAITLTDLIKSFHYDRYWLVGHSYGGPIIAYAAIHFPTRIAGLGIIAGSVSPELEPRALWRKWIDLPVIRQMLPVPLRVSNEELMPLKQDLMMMEDDWDRIHVPVSIIQGTLDVLVPYENLNYAKEKLTNADTVRTLIFEGENHFIVWTKHKEIVQEIRSLVKLHK